MFSVLEQDLAKWNLQMEMIFWEFLMQVSLKCILTDYNIKQTFKETFLCFGKYPYLFYQDTHVCIWNMNQPPAIWYIQFGALTWAKPRHFYTLVSDGLNKEIWCINVLL